MIPIEPAQITADWVTGALQDSFPGCRVANVEVVDWNAGTTGRARLKLAYEAESGAPPTIFVKLPPADEMQRAMVHFTGMGRREVSFYQGIARDVPVRVPQPYYAASNEEGTHYIMLLEDLVASGCDFPSLFGATLEHARSVIGNLAQVHAAFWDSDRFDADLKWVEPPMRHEIGPTLVKQSLDMFSDEMPQVFRDFGALYVERTEEVCDVWEHSGVATLCHGDCHIGNHFWDRKLGVAGFLDWAVLPRCPGVRDVVYFMGNSVPPEMAAEHEQPLLQDYRHQLEEAGVKPPELEDLWKAYGQHAGYSWVAAVTTLAMGDKWQQSSHALEATKRANQTLERLRTVELLQAELA